MIRAWIAAASMILVPISATWADDHPECTETGDSSAVIERRASFNRAIRDSDLETIRDVLAEEVVLVAGTHSDRFIGRDAQLAIWASDFQTPDSRWIYVRSPNCVDVSDVTRMAMEEGHWRGEGPDGSASGSYTAKWRVIDGAWQLEAEIFMTEECAGSACPESDG